MSRSPLIDRPIVDPGHDSLELASYAEAMAKFIESCDTPVTIGIQGDWGIGKTSFLNLVADGLKRRRGRRIKTPIIYFNTWQYAQFNSEEYLGVAVLSGILAAIEADFPEIEQDRLAKLKDYSRSAFSLIARTGNQLVKRQTGIDVQAAIEEERASDEDVPMARMIRLLQNYKAEFERLVNECVVTGERDRLVIMIDDLDRVRPSRALELLEAIKNFLDVPKCVFLLAVDYSVIQQGVADKLGQDTQRSHGKSYFDKIIQVPFNMPTAAYRLDRYIMSLLGAVFDDKATRWILDPDASDAAYLPRPGKGNAYKREDVEFFKNTTALSIGSNPRGMKRVANYAKLLSGVRQRNNNASYTVAWNMESAKLLYALACFQLEWPELFAYFADHPSIETIKSLEDWDKIEQMPQLRPLLDREHDVELVKSKISGFFDELINQLDKDPDGSITAQAFEPLRKMMREANLTHALAGDEDTGWQAFNKIVKSTSGNEGLKSVERLKGLFEKSAWNDLSKFRLVPAGRRFCNMVWDGHQVGSLVSLTSRPVQWWIKLDRQLFEDPPIECSAWDDEGHYGVGNLAVDIDRLLDSELSGVEQLNLLFKAVRKDINEHEPAGHTA